MAQRKIDTKRSDEEVMAELMSEDGVNLRTEWLAHPYTRSQADKLGKSVWAAAVDLFKVCERSTDPDVQRAYGKYNRLESFRKVLRGEKEAEV